MMSAINDTFFLVASLNEIALLNFTAQSIVSKYI